MGPLGPESSALESQEPLGKSLTFLATHLWKELKRFLPATIHAGECSLNIQAKGLPSPTRTEGLGQCEMKPAAITASLFYGEPRAAGWPLSTNLDAMPGPLWATGHPSQRPGLLDSCISLMRSCCGHCGSEPSLFLWDMPNSSSRHLVGEGFLML